MTMRMGPALSVVCHTVAVGLVVLILGEPKPFSASAPQAVAVDLVTPDEVAKEEAPKEPEKREAPPRDTALAAAQTADKAAAASPPGPAPTSAEQPGAVAKPPQAADLSREHPVQALMGPAMPVPGMIDTGDLLALYNMRSPGTGFDAPAETRAELPEDDVSKFKQHLRRCWHLPDGLAGSDTRVVLRIALNHDGSLAGEPVLIEASASRDGPKVMQAAIQAVQNCQPYAFLPRERYDQWRELDVRFTPREMGGG